MKKQGLENPLITVNDPHSPATEAFRTLRTNIQFAGLDNPIKTILVAGVAPSTGKSTVAANLGVIMAQGGSSVLLVDADLRKPTLHRIFKCENQVGLTSLLIDDTLDLKYTVYKSWINNLHILASGPIPPNPAELLSSKKMKEIAALLAHYYEYVIYDSPPVVVVTDAAILSRLVDATILTIAYGQVSREAAALAVEQLRKAKANIIGAVLNSIPASGNYYYYYHYYAEDESQSHSRSRRKAVRYD